RATAMRDLRFALRLLARSPGFAAVAILTLALGMGANTAFFSVLHGVVFAELPCPAAARLVSVRHARADVAVVRTRSNDAADCLRAADAGGSARDVHRDRY